MAARHEETRTQTPDPIQPPRWWRRWGWTVAALSGVLLLLGGAVNVVVYLADNRWQTVSLAAAQDRETRAVVATMAEKTLATARSLAQETAVKAEARDEKLSALGERVAGIEGQLRGVVDDQRETLRLLRRMSGDRGGGRDAPAPAR